jgi:hypothetical protein
MIKSTDLKKKNAQIRHPTVGPTLAHSTRTLDELIGL